MSLGVNTNISSLTAQRALSTADRELATSMERLSTGKRINTAADDSAGMAIATRLTSQINGLNQAVKNANSAIALTQTIDGALDEVTDMLQRARELAVQSASSTVSSSDRAFIQDEITQLMAEVDRIATTTRYNGQTVLDGTFSGQSIQIGANKGESLALSVGNAASTAIGNFKISGDTIKEQTSTAGNNNITDAADDIIISGGSGTGTVDVATGDSAKQVAAKINALTSSTGVSAEAKTQAHIYTNFVADQTFTLKINGTSTGSFNISSTDVSAGVTAINTISATTGVTASATDDNRILLTAADGADMRVENDSTTTTLRAKNLSFDGAEITKKAVYASKVDSSTLTASRAHTFTNNSTGVVTNFSTAGTATAVAYEGLINTALSATAGVGAVRETTDNAATLGTGDYYLSHTATGDVYKITVATASVYGWEQALANTTVHANGSYKDESYTLSSRITVYDAGAETAHTMIGLRGDEQFGDFEIYSDSALSVNIADGNRTVSGTESTGVNVRAIDVAAAATSLDTAGSAIFSTTAIGTGAYQQTLTDSGALASKSAAAGTGAQKVGMYITESNTAAGTAHRVSFTVIGTDINGNDIRETVDTAYSGTADQNVTITQNADTFVTGALTKLEFATVTAINDITVQHTDLNNGVDSAKFGFLDKDTKFTYHGARTMGDFDIALSGTSQIDGAATAGDLDSSDTAFAAGASSNPAANVDTVTFQGGLELTSAESFAVTQSSSEGGTVATNDNYLTSATAALSSVSSVSLSTLSGAESALKTIDGAIESIATIRSSLGAVENRLEHTVDNLMNVSENSQAARAAITDADFSVESANLAKAQVLLQAGTAMLAQANAAPQMVLQLLQ